MAPGWQTAELEEEWVEEEAEDAFSQVERRGHDANSHNYGVSMRPEALKGGLGTVIVHAADGRGARLPLAGRLGLASKNMFSPLKLETMFEPPRVSSLPGEGSMASLSASNPDANPPFQFNRDQSGQSFHFTFSQPHNATPLHQNTEDETRLRLFQFRYDTYTRDHLSAIIDSIAVDSSSRTTSSTDPSRKQALSQDPALRPHKRIKISSPEEESSTIIKKLSRKRLSLPAPIAKNGRLLEPGSRSLGQALRLTSEGSHGQFRSNASSTINASESAHSLASEELASKLRQVALVSESMEDNVTTNARGHVTTSRGSRRTPLGLNSQHRAPQKRMADTEHENDQRRLASAATNITHIGPTDISPVPDQVGRMQFDRNAMKWVKRAGEESDDPFRDIESVAASGSGPSARHEQGGDSFAISFEASAQRVIDALTGEIDDPTSEEEDLHEQDVKVEDVNVTQPRTLGTPQFLSTPVGSRLQHNGVIPTPIRSAMKVTPVGTHGAESSSTGKLRSVSFSDGRKSGRIRGLHYEEDEDEAEAEAEAGDTSHSVEDHGRLEERPSMQPSFRTRHIVDMLGDLEYTGRDEEEEDDEDETPCKSSSRQQRSAVGSLIGDSMARPSFVAASSSSLVAKNSTVGKGVRAHDATFLTECSFGVAHDRLLECITDVQPFEPHWEELPNINLSGKSLDSLARLKEFMPKLEELVIDNNVVSWLSGLPPGLRLLSAVSNQLTGLTSYVHLALLESLDISRNQIDSLLQLECLHRLRELKAEHNQIRTLEGLRKLGRLQKLSLMGNTLTDAELSSVDWGELEYLDLSENKLERVEGLERLARLTYVNLERNALKRLDIAGPMSLVRCLRVSDNRLEGSLDVRGLCAVRTLYADRNRLEGIIHGEKLERLETLSLRYQTGKRGLVVRARDVRDVRRLYLSGNALGGWFLEEPCYNLTYLELADCQLTAIPRDMGRMVPNVRVLNLNHNFVGSLDGLGELTRLRKLSMIGSRIRTSREVVKVVGRLGELEMVDLRMNPFSVSWYVPLLEGSGDEWEGLDAKFRRGLPDELYAGRLVYRGLLMRSCGRLGSIDGLRVSDGERVKAGELLGQLGQDGQHGRR